MGQERLITLCEICGAELYLEGNICQECQHAFQPVAEGETACEATPLDLRKYRSRMFPWEPITAPPRLISAHLVLAFSYGRIGLSGAVISPPPSAIAFLLGTLCLAALLGKLLLEVRANEKWCSIRQSVVFD
ncbi:MAG: hypothetical protein JO313_03585 [Verrucomicrobia bacterium]|nr:hypothetical protein [Verrucomicrobiota bacterium]